MNLEDKMILLNTIERIKNFEIPPIFKEGGRYANTDVEIIEADFNQEQLTKEIINNFKTMKVNIIMINGRISKKEYSEIINKIDLFFQGKYSTIVKNLKKEMADAAGKEEFEKAAVIRDQISSIEEIMEKQFVDFWLLDFDDAV